LVALTVGSLLFAYQLDRKQRETESARQDAVEARKVADANAREALDRYHLAIESLKVVTGKVQEHLENTPLTGPAREQILRALMEVLEKSLPQKERTGVSERGLASVHMIMGGLRREEGNWKEAVKHYDQAHALLTGLYQGNPDSDKAAGN